MSTSPPPTIKDRVVTYDVLRGIAVLGILLANIAAFGWPFGKSLFGSEPYVGADAWVDAGLVALVYGKFRSMLAILFGIGMALQYQKIISTGGVWPGPYLRRTTWLAVFGIVHGLFIWYGDILLAYSLTAFASCWLLNQSRDSIVRITKVVGGIALGLGLLAGLGMLALSFVTGLDLGGFGEIGPEVLVFSEGTYFQQLGYRGAYFAIMVMNLVFMLLWFVPLFWLGAIWCQDGVLRKPSAHPKVVKTALLLSFGIGLPIGLLSFGFAAMGQSSALWGMSEFVLGPVMAPGYLIAGAIWVERGGLKFVRTAFARVGQMALTTYIGQSLLCTTFFYSWGFAQFDLLSLSEMMLVVFGVWGINLVFAAIWLQFFTMGPVEWLWRSLTAKERLPIVRRKVAMPPVLEAPSNDSGN